MRRSTNTLVLRSAILTLLIVSSHFSIPSILSRSHPTQVRASLSQYPLQIGGWIGVDQNLSNPVLETLGVDDYLMREYRKGAEQFWLYIGYYNSQKGTKTIHSPKHCYPSSGWAKVKSSVEQIDVMDGEGGARYLPVNLYIVEKNGERELVLYWYQAGDRTDALEWKAFLTRMRNTVLRNRSDGALVRISQRIPDGHVPKMEEYREILNHVFGLQNRFIPK